MRESSETTQDLFSRWKKGDAQAGQDMAQRFSDWYFSISAAKFGETRSRPALERACQLFAQGIAQVETDQELESWAHSILEEELCALGDPEAVDEASRLTGQRIPSRLINRAISEARCSLLPLLAMAYDTSVTEEALKEACAAEGGFPSALLRARYELKSWLGIQESVPFQIQPDSPNLDYLPMPLYESGRLGADETRAFERWMLQDTTLSKDLAEFSSISLALRGGLLSQLVPSGSAPSPRKTSRRSERVQLSYQVPDGESWSPEPWMIVFGACLLGIVAALLTLM